MVVNAKGKTRWRIAQGKTRDGCCHFYWGSHERIAAKVTRREARE